MTGALREAAAKVPVPKKTKWPLQLAARRSAGLGGGGELSHNAACFYLNTIMSYRISQADAAPRPDSLSGCQEDAPDHV